MTTAPTTSPFLTVDVVAARWHLTPRAVRAEIGRKGLRASKIGGQWLIDPADVQAFEKSRLNVAPSPKRTRQPRRRSAR